MKKLTAYILLIVGAAALLWGGYLFVNDYMNAKDAKSRADDALIKIQGLYPERIPGSIYEETAEQEMPIVEINGLPLVGYVEIPEAGCAFVVQNRWGDPAVSRMKEGNTANGTGVIITDRIPADLIDVGMTVSFTDINGVVYNFVTDAICNENDTVRNAKLVLIAEGMSRTVQIACIEK